MKIKILLFSLVLLATLTPRSPIITGGQAERGTFLADAFAESSPATEECQLIVSPIKTEFSATESVVLLVTLKNLSTKRIRYGRSNPRNDYRIEGKNQVGETIFQTDYWGVAFANISGYLPAGSEKQFQLKLNDFKVSTQESNFFIIVKRKVYGHYEQEIELTSNPAEIKIKQAKN